MLGKRRLWNGVVRLGAGTRWMSARPQTEGRNTGEALRRKKVTIQLLHYQRSVGTPITMLTAYDYPTARACDSNEVDITLVGDSLAQVALGYDSTTRLSMDEMIHHCQAVARGSKIPLLVADMPFGSYQASEVDALRNAMRLVKDGGAEAVKLEGGTELVSTVKRLTTMGIPVMAHVGLLPQRAVSFSGYRTQGRLTGSAREILHAALSLEEAGAFSVVLEAIPHLLGTYITHRLRIPSIGIGAGPGTNGQVLVWDDAMGIWSGHKAKFVRRFAEIRQETQKGVSGYIEAVKTRSFPDIVKESYDMDQEEWKRLLELEGDQDWAPE